MPPSAGITIRVDCHNTEFRATADISPSRSIRCGNSACRVGHSTPVISELTAAIASTCQTRTVPLKSSTASSPSSVADNADVTSTMRRLSKRS